MNTNSAYQKQIVEFASKDFTTLDKNLSAGEALDTIREQKLSERIIYFYVLDEEKRLVGVLPTRRLLMSRLDQKIDSIMVKNVAALQHTSSVYDALEFFATYRFLAFPVIDDERRILGVVDVNFFTDKLLNADEPEEVSDVFEEIGFKISEVKNASSLKAWRYRFPWFLATIASGSLCAVLAGVFGSTITSHIIIVSFMTLVLGLSESMSIQSMTVTIQMLHSANPSVKWYIKNLLRELQSAFLIGISSALIVGLIVLVLKLELMNAVLVSTSIALTQVIAAVLGISVPSVVHALKLDPKIAAGPVTLGLSDVFTITVYLALASLLL